MNENKEYRKTCDSFTEENTSQLIYKDCEYTDGDLFQLLDLNNPTDRELEAKLYSLIEKYNSIKSNIGQQLKHFYISVFNHFFETDNDETIENNSRDDNDDNNNHQDGFENMNDKTSENFDQPENPTYTKSLDYTRGSLNPILKETIKRVVCIDSSFRNVDTYPYTTDFTFNLSETLRDVVSLKLYSVSIPYNWYTINKNYGSNFFYINGISNGINNGNFNYKISIPYGNYTESSIVEAVNQSIQTDLIDANQDINFGSTKLSHNPVNGLCTLNIDIKNNYNETNYYLYFPNIIRPSFENPSSIPELLGYTEQTYYPFAIYSKTKLYDNNQKYLLTSDNNRITLIIYSATIDDNKISSIKSLSPSNRSIDIYLSLPTNKYYNSNEIIDDLNFVLANHADLVKISSLLTQPVVKYNIDGTTPLLIKYMLNIKPNRKFFSQGLNQKMVIKFPNESKNKEPIWCNYLQSDIGQYSTSLFNFNYKVIDTNNYISDEMQNINSELDSPITSYVFNSTPYIILKCTKSGYASPEASFATPYISYSSDFDFSYNDYRININSIPLNKAINLNQYYSAIQTSFDNLNSRTNGQIIGTIGTIDNKPTMNFNINVILKDYKLQSNVLTKLNFPETLSNNKIYTSYINVNTGYNIDGSFYVYNFINQNAISMIKLENYSNISISELINTINKAFLSNDFLNKTSISSKQYTSTQYQLELSVNIQSILQKQNYKMYLLDGSSNFSAGDTPYSIYGSNNFYYNKNISWYSILGFRSNSYDLSSSVVSDVSINANLLSLTKLNNTFQLKPIYDPSGGVYDTISQNNNILTYTLDIRSNPYSKEEICNLINSAFLTQNNGIAKGSYIDITNTTTTIRLNINKTFTAKDYSVQFYNSSFVKCDYGPKSSIETVTTDTTLGWKLGFRSNISYDLTEANVSTNLDGSTYYGNNISNKYTYDKTTGIVTLTGDTSVNVNLYNYFLIILDDYTQNHLNDGLITTITLDSDVPLPSYAPKSICVAPNIKGVSNTSSYENFNQLTNAQIYSANQILNTKERKNKKNIFSSGPFIQDIFGIIPMKTSGLSYGQTYTEFGGTLQIQERVYFGPVNISRMTVKLMTDKGNTLDLNNQNWSFTLITEQLYNPNKI